MASGRKQGHLEAGKKRLEEFRKKKAEGRAKKAASTGQLQSADLDQHEKSSQSYENVRSGATSGGDGINADESSGVIIDHEEKAINKPQETDIGFSNGAHAYLPPLVKNNHASYDDLRQADANIELSYLYRSSGLSELDNGHYDHWRDEDNEVSHDRRHKHGPYNGPAIDLPPASNTVNTYPNNQLNENHPRSYSLVEAQLEENRNPSKSSTYYTETPGVHLVGMLTEKSEINARHNSLELPSTAVNSSLDEPKSGVEQHMSLKVNNHDSLKNADTGRSKIADSISRHLNVDSSPWHAPELSSTDSGFTFRNAFDQHPLPSTGWGAVAGRSRPSFLDSLGVTRVSSTPHVPFIEPEKANSAVSNSKFWSAEIPSTQQDFNSDKLPLNSSVSSNDELVNASEIKDYDSQRNHDMVVVKKDEDFAALEQHIEDLTQEKFSLQRALDTSRALAESLAAENSSLTDSYNQQGSVVSQLKSDMERLQEEIKAQLLALDSVKMEHANAQLECNAADERAKLLASEVISLEEKALRLRSNELKLEKQVDNLNSEITSYKRKVSTLEKERQDFQLTIDALQEEKKLLQTKLRKASVSGKVIDTKTASLHGKDVSTSTEDLGVETSNLVDGETIVAESVFSSTINAQDIGPSVFPSDHASIFLSQPDDRGFLLSESSSDIPHDQLRMIDNIQSLISELALEKEELMRTLTMESSNNAKLKDLNKDLSRKLEAQTQRLELLTAQRMANENMMAKPIDTRGVNDTTEYADEGDEVVERVLGWIMKFFPGGSAKRRTSKLL